MKVQRVRISGGGRAAWLVLRDDYLPVRPVQQFLVYLENLERSPNTIRSYAYHLKLYWTYLSGAGLEWTAVGLTELTGFISWLRDPNPGVLAIGEQVAGRRESTINSILAAVAAFYDYHERTGLVANIPFYTTRTQHQRRYKAFLHHVNTASPVRSRLIKLKEPRLLPKTLTKEQIEQVEAACNLLRDRFLIRLLYETGMRVGQALGLRHEDVRSWDNEIRIVPRQHNTNGARAKTCRSYTLHVPESLMTLYAQYLVHEFEEIDSDYVFVNLRAGAVGRPLRYSAVADMFRRLSAKTGIAVHPHMLRHTHATDLFRSGWDAALVQRRLGHASVQTTIDTYAHLDDADMKRHYQAYQAARGQS